GTNTLSQANYILVTNPPPLLSLIPTNLDFGAVGLGLSRTQNFQVVNTGGLTLTGSVAATLPFSISSGSPYTVAPGQTGSVSASFSPLSAGHFSNAVIFISNGGNSTNSVTGVGLTPGQLAVSPARVDFGLVDVDAGQIAYGNLLVTNRGGSPISN